MEAKPPIIRDAYPGEGRVILDVWRHAYQDGDLHGDLDDVERLIEGEAAARLLVAEADGRLVATLIATFDGWRGNMYRIAVLPDYRRRGIGRRLVAEAETWLRAIGCRKITALVVKDHAWATSFWRAAGYEIEDFMGRYARTLS